ncbi:transcription elongation factor Elf1 like-domain-containing protein [Helicostylum pulchrum]|uniref:Transcription elongation factor 1 homolog n=1 Tax=Helicostylum pulchrum TaxID=562976 RepID=A0ABP9YF58_9FUNG|nr:transcription elongation factor Elf1 like-domain-containing protein [Helicostylum pulchrum]
MGKRKTKRKPQKKLKDKLDVQFNCLFCNHENSIECKIDHTNKVGLLSCKVCDVSWQCVVTYLDEPVDVYSGWIDACEEVNKQKKLQALKQRERATNREDSRSPPPQDRLDPFDEDDEDY